MEVLEELDSKVRANFVVRDYFLLDDGSVEYKVQYDAMSKSRFKVFVQDLQRLGYVPRLNGSKVDAVLLITKESSQSVFARASVILLLLTFLSIIVTGWLLASIFERIAPDKPALLMTVGFVASVLAILGLHEFAHNYISRRGSRSSSIPYYVPNIPLFSGLPILSFLPTFGSITFTKSPTLNRDSLFNLYFVGPVAGILVALVISIFGAATSILLPQGELTRVFGPNAMVVNMNPSLLQGLMVELTTAIGLSSSPKSGFVYISSPIYIAAWIGFLVTFLSLLPATIFDGGRMTAIVLGDRGNKIITTLTSLLLLLIDAPNYWVMVLLIFLLAARPATSETLDSISDISNSTKVLYVLSLALLFLSAPIPNNIATIPLRFEQ
jgi:membrane-associated protease RseP (regulator of RpoE activity)